MGPPHGIAQNPHGFSRLGVTFGIVTAAFAVFTSAVALLIASARFGSSGLRNLASRSFLSAAINFCAFSSTLRFFVRQSESLKIGSRRICAANECAYLPIVGSMV